MFIYFNGDSNVAGEELSDPSQGMAGVMARHFNADSVNDAVSGSSNDRIYDTTLEYLRNNPRPDLMVIGWTEHGREQWYFDGKMHEINQLDVGNRVPEEFRRRHQFWKHQIKNDEHWFRVMGNYWHNKIYNLHTMLREQEIPHYFFNIFFHFHHDERQQLNWHNCFYRPYAANKTYINWCNENKFYEITPGWQHYDATAHEMWATELVTTMKRDGIV